MAPRKQLKSASSSFRPPPPWLIMSFAGSRHMYKKNTQGWWTHATARKRTNGARKRQKKMFKGVR